MIQKYENVLSGFLLDKLHNFSRDGRQPTETNFFSWQEQVVTTSNAIFKFKLSDELFDEVCEEFIKKGIFPNKPKDADIAIQLYSRMAFIAWHEDAKYKFSGTVYLNQQWKPDWGGYFAYEENNEIKAIKPVLNQGVFFVPPMQHTVFSTSLDAPLRESLQIFVREF
jgi:Rps23 Pro-64 3,4-dihydroxylase Tpa1-like proline 4-hydroxylase